jgi:hypothetical protein
MAASSSEWTPTPGDIARHDKMMTSLPDCATLLASIPVESSVNMLPPPLPLDDGNLRTAVDLFLGEAHGAFGLPFVPRDLRRLIADYTVACPNQIMHYYIYDIDAWNHSGGDIDIDTDQFILSKQSVRTWCLSKLIDSFHNLELDKLVSSCSNAGRQFHLPKLEALYASLTDHQLLQGTMHWFNQLHVQNLYSSSQHRLLGVSCDAFGRVCFVK